MDFNVVDLHFVASATSRRNHIPRKFLDYHIPPGVFMGYMDLSRAS